MKTTDLIAQHLLDVHSGHNWTEVSIAGTVNDISEQKAMMKVNFTGNSIAMLLHHISYWNRVVAQRAAGIKPVINASNGFSLENTGNENDWAALIADNIKSAGELATAIRNFDEHLLQLPILPEHSSAYRNFQGSVEHVHYHLGQIVMIKKAIRNK